MFYVPLGARPRNSSCTRNTVCKQVTIYFLYPRKKQGRLTSYNALSAGTYCVSRGVQTRESLQFHKQICRTQFQCATQFFEMVYEHNTPAKYFCFRHFLRRLGF